MRNLEKILRLVRLLPTDSNDAELVKSFSTLLATTTGDITTKLYREILYNPLGNKDVILNQVPEPFTQYLRGFRSILARNARINDPTQYLTKQQIKDITVQQNLVGNAERQILALRKAMRTSIASITNDIKSAMRDGINPGQLESRLNAINQQLTHVENLYARFATSAIPKAYAQGAEITRSILESPSMSNNFLFDNKTVNSLIKHATDDFTRGIQGARGLIGFSYKVSKQAFLTEQEISQLVAAEYMASGDAKKVQKKIFEAFANLQGRNKNPSSKIVTGINRDITNIEADLQFESILKDKVQALRNSLPNMTQAEFEKRMAKTLKAINEEKYIRIVNKNGDYMHFTLDHYSELVTRTRIGDSQVAGTMEMALKDGIDLFRITAHNTTSIQCIKHEGQFYSTNQNLVGKEFQGKKIGLATRENLPLYHPGNCLHRVVAVPYLDDELTGTSTMPVQAVNPVSQQAPQQPNDTSNTQPTQPMQQDSQMSVMQDLINARNRGLTIQGRRAADTARIRNQYGLTGRDIDTANIVIANGNNAPIDFASLAYADDKALYNQLGNIIQAKINDARKLLEKQMLPDLANKALVPIIKKLSAEKYVRIKNESGKWVFLTLKEARQAGLKF